MHELAVLAWRRDLTVGALLTLTELLDWPDRTQPDEAGGPPPKDQPPIGSPDWPLQSAG